MLTPINFSLWVKPLHPDLIAKSIPLARQTPGSAGLDLSCMGNIIIRPGDEMMVETGLAIWIETSAIMGMIVPRSSIGRRGLVLQNTVGIIDSDYQGQLLLALRNVGKTTIELQHMERVAQLCLVQIVNVTSCLVVEKFPNETARGAGGFGSTGKS